MEESHWSLQVTKYNAGQPHTRPRFLDPIQYTTPSIKQPVEVYLKISLIIMTDVQFS